MSGKIKNIVMWILIVCLSIALVISLVASRNNDDLNEINSYKEKIELYEINEKNHKNKIEELNAELEKLKNEKEQDQKELNQYLEENETLTKKNKEYLDKIGSLNKKIANTSNETLKKEFEKQISDLQSKLTTNDNVIKENNSKISGLEEAIKEKDKLIEENASTISKYKEEIAQLENKVKELENLISSYEETNDDKDNKIKALEEEMEYIKSYIDKAFVEDMLNKDTVKLTKDTQMVTKINLENKNVTLDLNGYKLYLYEINLNSSNLRIVDSSEEKTGTVELNYAYGYYTGEDGLNNKAGIQVNSDSTLTIDGGIILGEYTIKVNDGGKIIVNTGSFEQTSERYTTSLIKINKGGEGYIYGGIFGKNGYGGIQNVGYLEVDARVLGKDEKDPYTEQSEGEYNLKMFGNYFVYNLDPKTDEHGTLVFKNLHNTLESFNSDGPNPIVINTKGTVDLTKLYYVPHYDFVISSYDEYAKHYYPEYPDVKMDESKIIYKNNPNFKFKSKDDYTFVLEKKD